MKNEEDTSPLPRCVGESASLLRIARHRHEIAGALAGHANHIAQRPLLQASAFTGTTASPTLHALSTRHPPISPAVAAPLIAPNASPPFLSSVIGDAATKPSAHFSTQPLPPTSSPSSTLLSVVMPRFKFPAFLTAAAASTATPTNEAVLQRAATWGLNYNLSGGDVAWPAFRLYVMNRPSAEIHAVVEAIRASARPDFPPSFTAAAASSAVPTDELIVTCSDGWGAQYHNLTRGEAAWSVFRLYVLNRPSSEINAAIESARAQLAQPAVEASSPVAKRTRLNTRALEEVPEIAAPLSEAAPAFLQTIKAKLEKDLSLSIQGGVRLSSSSLVLPFHITTPHGLFINAVSFCRFVYETEPEKSVWRIIDGEYRFLGQSVLVHAAGHTLEEAWLKFSAKLQLIGECKDCGRITRDGGGCVPCQVRAALPATECTICSLQKTNIFHLGCGHKMCRHCAVRIHRVNEHSKCKKCPYCATHFRVDRGLMATRCKR